MRGDDFECRARGAGTHAAGTFRGHQRSRHRADGRRGAAENLDKRIREETGLPVSIADDPLASVVLGTGKMLSDFKLLRMVCID